MPQRVIVASSTVSAAEALGKLNEAKNEYSKTLHLSQLGNASTRDFKTECFQDHTGQMTWVMQIVLEY